MQFESHTNENPFLTRGPHQAHAPLAARFREQRSEVLGQPDCGSPRLPPVPSSPSSSRDRAQVSHVTCCSFTPGIPNPDWGIKSIITSAPYVFWPLIILIVSANIFSWKPYFS